MRNIVYSCFAECFVMSKMSVHQYYQKKKEKTKNMLFDEKIGGTIHLAVGSGYPETGSKNDSGIHWDMLCNMDESEITVDGDLMYKDGKFEI